MEKKTRSLFYLNFGLLLLFSVGCLANVGITCDFSKVGLWKTCGYSNFTQEQCAKQNCCFGSNSFVLSKNLSQNCVKPPDAFEWKNGTCHKYNGTVCLKYLGNRTLGREVFFDIRYGVASTEAILRQFIRISDLSVKGSQLCRHLIPTGVCQMMLPLCNAESRPELSCREDCDQIHQFCPKDIDRFYGALELFVKTQDINFSHLNIPTCTDFRYSYEYDYKKNESCTFVGGSLPCSNTLSSTSGVIRHSMSQGKYLPNHNCTWKINVQTSFHVKLTFTKFDIEASKDCMKDYVIIRNGPYLKSSQVSRLCGKDLPPVITISNNEVLIQFVTDANKQASGFILNYAQFTPDTKSDSVSISKQNIIIIAACAAAAFLALLLFIFLRWRWNKRQDYKRQELEKDMELFTGFTTVRDRIRQDSMPNPLMEALSRINPEHKPPQCRLDRVEYVKDLGQGQFGKVFQGRFKLGQDAEEISVAVKMLKEGSSAETKDSFIQEVTLMTVLYHQNILKLLAVSTEEEPFCMVFEYMVNGDLNTYLRKNDPENTEETEKVSLSTDNLVNMAAQIASGMQYLSEKRFVHRDLATRNCLVGEESVVKIADFGMSRDVYESDYYRVGGAAMLPIRWMPPEALLYGKFTVESDVYSYGILLWEIFTYALQPFYGYSNDEVVKFIKKGVVLPKPDICPNEIYDKVMTKCWFKDPEKRLNFEEILKRLKGDYEYAQEHVPKKPKKDPVPTYSVPPSRELQPEPTTEGAPKRIPSKKESPQSSPQYVNYQVGKEKQGNTIELRAKNGAFPNPLYGKSVNAEDLYDRPKSHSISSDDGNDDIGKTVALPNARNTVVADDLYDRPKSNARAYPELEEQFEGGTVPLPERSSRVNLVNESGYANPAVAHEDEDDNGIPATEEELEVIARKRYVSPNDVRRLSKKESKSSIVSNSST
ncbi:inactive tyrosine-protein kinase transmembrane receptor ROR1-like [Rhopilema esculentum]|uniref:inactive tyrosine-protein kinase transmembrane receptor ROR1-like n=1 Tax=Rhopilema esculentum TaxID=499914 RepID=UPI0031D16182